MHKSVIHYSANATEACRLANHVIALRKGLAVSVTLLALDLAPVAAQVRQLPPLRTQPIPGSIVDVAFAADGKLLAATYVAPGRALAKVWDVAAHKEIVTLPSNADLTKDPRASLMSVAFSPDGKTLALAGTRERTRLYDTATWKVRDELFVPNRPDVYGDQRLAFAPDGKTIATVREYGGLVRLWDNPSGRFLCMLGCEAGISPDATTFSPNGKTIASVGVRGIILWDSEQRKNKGTLAGLNRRGRSLAFSPDGRYLAAAWEQSGLREKNAMVWDLSTDRVKAKLDVGDKYGEVHAVAFSRDSRILALAGRGTKPQGGKNKETAGILVSIGYVRLLDVVAGRDLALLKLPGITDCVAFSAAAPTLAVGCLDGAVHLYDVSQLVGKKQGALPPQGPPQIEIKPTGLESGKVFYETLETTTKHDFVDAGQNHAQEQKQTFWFGWRLKAKKADSYVLAQKILRARVDANIAGDQQPNLKNDPFKQLAGCELTITVGKNKEGNYQVEKVEGIDELAGRLKKANPAMEEYCRTVLAEDAIKRLDLPLIDPFPPRGVVPPGKTWSTVNSVDMGPVGSYLTRTRYTYVGKEGGLDRIKTAIEKSYAAPQKGKKACALGFQITKGKLKSKESEGTFLFSREKGLFISADLTIRLEGAITVEIANQQTKVGLDQTQVTRLRVADRNPLEKQ